MIYIFQIHLKSGKKDTFYEQNVPKMHQRISMNKK